MSRRHLFNLAEVRLYERHSDIRSSDPYRRRQSCVALLPMATVWPQAESVLPLRTQAFRRPHSEASNGSLCSPGRRLRRQLERAPGRSRIGKRAGGQSCDRCSAPASLPSLDMTPAANLGLWERQFVGSGLPEAGQSTGLPAKRESTRQPFGEWRRIGRGSAKGRSAWSAASCGLGTPALTGRPDTTTMSDRLLRRT
jgi:hypothetical protein